MSASFAGGAARYDMLDTVRDYVLERLAESGGLAAARAAHAEYFAALADEARVELRGPEWLRWQRRLELENDNLWAALEYARDAPDPAVAVRLGTLGWYFALAERVSEGRRFLELALSATSDDAPVELRIELLADLCYLATEELDLDRRARGGRTRALARRDRRGAEAAGARAADARARPRTVRRRSGPPRWRKMRRDAFEAAGDDWGAAASSLIRAIGAAHAGRRLHRRRDGGGRPPSLGRDRLRRVPRPGLLLEAWVAERRGDGAAAVDAYRRALELAARIGFGDHAAFALSGLGTSALASGDLREAEELQRQALATAEAAEATLVAAHARVQLARIAAASGDADGAERLYRQVIEWSQLQRPHQARESLFVALAGNPAPPLRRSPGPPTLAASRRSRHRAHLASWQKRRRAWQSVGIGGGEPSWCQTTDRQEART